MFIAKETLGFRRSGISPDLRLLMPTFSLLWTPPKLALELRCPKNASLPHHCEAVASVSSVSRLAPLNFRREISKLVSCYALFKGWLLLSQPPSCQRSLTSFSTELPAKGGSPPEAERFRDLRRQSGLFSF